MGSKFLYARTLRGRLHHVPDRFGRDSMAPDLAEPTHRAEDQATIDASRIGPHIDGTFRPRWNRNGADVLSFANQISDHPVFLSDLEIARSESLQFSASQSAPDEECENRSIALPAQVVCLGRAKQGSGLFNGQPVANSNALGVLLPSRAGCRRPVPG